MAVPAGAATGAKLLSQPPSYQVTPISSSSAVANQAVYNTQSAPFYVGSDGGAGGGNLNMLVIVGAVLGAIWLMRR